MLSADSEKRLAAAAVGDMDQVAGGHHGVEATSKVEREEVGTDLLGPGHVLEHRFRVVHGDYRMPQGDQGPRQPPGATSQLENGTTGGDRLLDQTRDLACRKRQVHRHRASVGTHLTERRGHALTVTPRVGRCGHQLRDLDALRPRPPWNVPETLKNLVPECATPQVPSYAG